MKNGGGDLNSRYKTYTDKIWQIKCKHNKNGGGYFNSRYKIYTDKYDKLSASIRKMADDFIPRYKAYTEL